MKSSLLGLEHAGDELNGADGEQDDAKNAARDKDSHGPAHV